MERGCRPAVGRGGEGVGYWGAVAHIIASVRDERQLALLPLLRQPRWRRHKRREQVSTVQRVPVQPFEKRRFRNVRALPHGHHRAVCGHGSRRARRRAVAPATGAAPPCWPSRAATTAAGRVMPRRDTSATAASRRASLSRARNRAFLPSGRARSTCRVVCGVWCVWGREGVRERVSQSVGRPLTQLHAPL